MFYAIGIGTRTMYAMGKSKVDCLRELNAKYPSFEYSKANLKNKTKTIEQILPEPIQIMRGKLSDEKRVTRNPNRHGM